MPVNVKPVFNYDKRYRSRKPPLASPAPYAILLPLAQRRMGRSPSHQARNLVIEIVNPIRTPPTNSYPTLRREHHIPIPIHQLHPLRPRLHRPRGTVIQPRRRRHTRQHDPVTQRSDLHARSRCTTRQYNRPVQVVAAGVETRWFIVVVSTVRGRADRGLQDGLVPHGADGDGATGRRRHGRGGEAGFVSAVEGGDDGLPGGVGPGGLVGVAQGVGGGAAFGPEGADVVAFWAVVLDGGVSWRVELS